MTLRGVGGMTLIYLSSFLSSYCSSLIVYVCVIILLYSLCVLFMCDAKGRGEGGGGLDLASK